MLFGRSTNESAGFTWGFCPKVIRNWSDDYCEPTLTPANTTMRFFFTRSDSHVRNGDEC